ncbi:MAG: TolC family protein [Proteiniphilum sp.]|nr:TolC family protein [Proteiniphilum sp.]
MRRTIILYALLFSVTVSAQESLTLEGAIQRALAHSPALNVEKMKNEAASIEVEESRLQHIPDIYLSGEMRRNLVIPATPVPAHVFDSSAKEGELMYLKFNTKYNSSAGINLRFDLFNPEKINQVAEKKHQQRIQKYDTEISEEDLKERVALAYAECVIAEEQKKLLRGDTTYYAELLCNARQLYLKEKISLSGKNDTHRAYNESVAAYLEAAKIAGDRKAELIYLMGMDVTAANVASLSLAEDIPALLGALEMKALPAYGLTPLEVLRQQEAVDLASLRLKSASWKYAPTVTLNGYYGTNYYNQEFTLFNNNLWRGSSYIGISLRVPVTQSFSTSKEVSRLRLQQLMEQENLRDIRNNREKERLNELSLLQVRKESYRLNRENWEMSQQNEAAVLFQFEKGYIQQSDLLNEKMKMQQNRHRFLQSAYDLFSSLILLGVE